jgi:hypothetical protein
VSTSRLYNRSEKSLVNASVSRSSEDSLSKIKRQFNFFRACLSIGYHVLLPKQFEAAENVLVMPNN